VLFESFSSLKDALRAVYPHYSWDPRLFTDKGRHSKEQLSNKNALFQEIVQAEPKIGIKQVMLLLPLNQSTNLIRPSSLRIGILSL